MYNKIRGYFLETLDSNVKYNLIQSLQSALKDIFALLVNLCILSVGSYLAIQGRISIGELIAFNALLSYFLDPIEEIISLQDEIQTAKVANSRINQIKQAPSEKQNSLNNSLCTPLPLIDDDAITVSKLSFEYKYGQEILHNLNLKVKRGESIAIVGLSGSGKSTLAKLLINFYQPTSGSIKIGGKTISEIDIPTLRKTVSYLPQSPYIFAGSVSENIALGASDVSRDAIVRAAKLAEIDADIQKMPNKYDTRLSENAGLSGGQLQRLAIARAILNDAPIMIFDESTSNLDLLTEKKILNNILNLHEKTLIFIAHRLSIAKSVNQIWVMQNGKVIESGLHDTLLAEKGTYFNLVS